jgi:sucrose phosphorylase
MTVEKVLAPLIESIYGPRCGTAVERVTQILDRFRTGGGAAGERFSEKDTVLITYADTLRREGHDPLQALYDFAATYLSDAISAIHLLPFYPYSSDDGFSVIDYLRVNPAVGTWDGVAQLGSKFDLMFDFVLNHISAKSGWFKAYLDGREGFSDLAIEMAPEADLSDVVRPRTHPLLTPFVTASGREVHLWTTFSADQIDLNYKSIDVLCRMIEVLLCYVEHGARFIRMDAVAYVWKTAGTRSIHLPEAHALVRLFRGVLDLVAPDTVIITETNVPHAENISYFGNGFDEAQMVYNFTLPPLLLYTFTTGNTDLFSQWAGGLHAPSEATTFFNFTASHDGIGVRPLEGILSDAQIEAIIAHVRVCGGEVSSKRNSDGSSSPYELNVTYVDAMGTDRHRGTPMHARRFLASQAIALALPGVPAVYIHSLLGSRNWKAGVQQTGRNRTINRQPLDADRIAAALNSSERFRATIFNGYRTMLAARRREPAFHPNAVFEVLSLGSHIFGLCRRCREQAVYALTSVKEEPISVASWGGRRKKRLRDLLGGRHYPSEEIRLSPYQTVWLTESPTG